MKERNLIYWKQDGDAWQAQVGSTNFRIEPTNTGTKFIYWRLIKNGSVLGSFSKCRDAKDHVFRGLEHDKIEKRKIREDLY